MKLVTALVVAILVSVGSFSALAVLGLFNSSLSLTIGSLAIGALATVTILTVLLAILLWGLFSRIPREFQIVIIIMMFIVGLVTLEIGVGEILEILAAIGTLFEIIQGTSSPTKKALR